MLSDSKVNDKLLIIAGPCVIEDTTSPYDIAQRLVEICSALPQVQLIFKASYKKANRTKLTSFTGIGDVEALRIIQGIGKKYDIPTTTDVHSVEDVTMAAEFVDILQIPAFLCRQTDLLIAAGATGKVVNIKKGQFMNPESMEHAVLKTQEEDLTRKVWLTERGTTFGYHDLVVDFKSIPKMKQYAPVIMDCTHSLQQPNQTSGVTGGSPEYIGIMAKAAIAVGADGLFIETHPNPSVAKSDGANMLALDQLEPLLKEIMELFNCIRK